MKLKNHYKPHIIAIGMNIVYDVQMQKIESAKMKFERYKNDKFLCLFLKEYLKDNFLLLNKLDN